MLIVDSQVHIWSGGEPLPHHNQPHRPNPFTKDALIREMDAAGVHRAMLAPPHWDLDPNGTALEAARLHPERFRVVGHLPLEEPESPARFDELVRRPGILGLRYTFNSPETQAWLRDGSAEWVWEKAERAGVPVMVLLPGALSAVADIATRHPGLKVIVDHLGIPRGYKDAAAFAHLPELLTLAKYPNVAIKACGIPGYSSKEPFPYPSLHKYLRQVFDGFGPDRVFWGSDLSRMACAYSDCVRMFTEGLPWLAERDKELIMGRALCQWLGWKLP